MRKYEKYPELFQRSNTSALKRALLRRANVTLSVASNKLQSSARCNCTRRNNQIVAITRPRESDSVCILFLKRCSLDVFDRLVFPSFFFSYSDRARTREPRLRLHGNYNLTAIAKREGITRFSIDDFRALSSTALCRYPYSAERLQQHCSDIVLQYCIIVATL